jgi:hypothetical protein
VEALIEMERQEGKRRQGLDEAVAEVHEFLAKGDAGGAMARLNRSVVRYGDLEELQALRYEVARAFLEEDAFFEGDATHAPTPPSSKPRGAGRRPVAGAPSQPPRAAAPPPPGAPSPPPPSPAPMAMPAAAAVGPGLAPGQPPGQAPSQQPAHLAAPPDSAEPTSVSGTGTVWDMPLAGLGGESNPLPFEAKGPSVPSHNPWLDLRDPRGWILLILVLALVALLGHWLATRGRGGPAPDQPPVEDVEDVVTPPSAPSVGASSTVPRGAAADPVTAALPVDAAARQVYSEGRAAPAGGSVSRLSRSRDPVPFRA